jgi:hypothetical protein
VLSLLAVGAAHAQTSVNSTSNLRPDGYRVVTWTALGKNNAGSPFNAGSLPGLKTVQIVVTAAGEQSLTIQGSMDGANWFTLNAISLVAGEYLSLSSLTTSGIYAIIEDPLFLRPLVSNDTGATAVDIDVIIGALTSR